MHSVSQILQRCKENAKRDSVRSTIAETYRYSKYDPAVWSLDEFTKEVMECEDKDVMEYLQSVSDIMFLPKVDMCPSNELVRVIGCVNVQSLLSEVQRDYIDDLNERAMMSSTEITRRCGTPDLRVRGSYGYVLNYNPLTVVSYSPSKEWMWSPKACLLIILRASIVPCRVNSYRAVCGRVRKDLMAAAAQLDKEARLAEETARRLEEKRQKEALETQKKQAEKPVVKPEPAQQTKEVKASDDSKVVINMTPELLTVMIKTAVTESVNAVWQKFIDNKDIFLNT